MSPRRSTRGVPAFGELPAEPALHLVTAGQHHQPGCRHVQPMNDARLRKVGHHPSRQTILLVLAAPRHRQQSGRFVEHQCRRVGMPQHVGLPPGWIIGSVRNDGGGLHKKFGQARAQNGFLHPVR